MTGSKRNSKKDGWMPSRVYQGKSAYEWRPKGGGCVRLCGLESTRSQVWAAFEEAEAARGKRPRVTVGDLWVSYAASPRFSKRAARTQADYRDYWKFAKLVFENVDATKVQPKHIREYMDNRVKTAAAEGRTATTRANREKTLLQNIFAYAYEYGIVKINPCIGVKKFEESPRDYYIDDEEYQWFYDESPEIIQLFMELSYLNGSRGQDIRLIMMHDLKDLGIYIRQQKTGKKQIKEWTERLEQVIERAKVRRASILDQKRGKVESLYLLVSRTGSPYTADGLKTLWAKNRQRIEEKFEREIKFTYHDIKAKGTSDYEGDKQKFTGHKSRGQMETYNRKPELVKTLQVPPMQPKKSAEKK